MRQPHQRKRPWPKLDSVIYDRLEGDQPVKDVTSIHLEQFANIGLRTLCIATATIPADFYETWKMVYYEASTSIRDREKKLEDAAELIERNLCLLGATAIEDKLQDGIPETIENLTRANIKIWILTGDKQETAINIGYSCRLLTPKMKVILLNEDSVGAMMDIITSYSEAFAADSVGQESNVGLVIDGESLKFALSPGCRQQFLKFAVSCKSVICCRVSPLQKAEIVEMVRNDICAITLAIGDGANDVGMIQKAHVGVGISGVEGLQAACASDYSIAQFRYLNKLLLVHGAWSYHRLTKVILYSFYKNICLYVIEFWFAMLTGFSGQVVFERWSIGLYNVVFTAAPPMAIGLFDRYCSADSMLQFPALYRSSQNSSFFNVKIFWLWCANAIYHSILLFWLTVLFLYQDVAFSNGLVGGYLFLGNMVYTYVVITVCVKAGLETSAWTYFTHLAIWGSIAFWFLFLIVYPQIWPTINIAPEMVGMTKYVFGCWIFWVALILVPIITLMRDFVWKVTRRTLFRTVREDVLEMERADKEPAYVALYETKKKVVETARILRNVFTRSTTTIATSQHMSSELQTHGYAFSQEEHGIMSQSELIRQYDTTHAKPAGL